MTRSTRRPDPTVTVDVAVTDGRIVEFECEEIEAAQAEIAGRYRFRLVRHRHELYGYCASCGSAR